MVFVQVELSLRESNVAKLHPMKSIHWKEVSSDLLLSQQFSIEDSNRFQALSTDIIDDENCEAANDNDIKNN